MGNEQLLVRGLLSASSCTRDISIYENSKTVKLKATLVLKTEFFHGQITNALDNIEAWCYLELLVEMSQVANVRDLVLPYAIPLVTVGQDQQYFYLD